MSFRPMILWLAGAALVATSHAEPPKPAPASERLPAPVRRAIGLRMVNHGTDLGTLVNAAIILDLESVEFHAREIANEPTLSRPMPGEADTLSAAVPKRFFDLQDQLKLQAKALAEAAHQRDKNKVAHTFGQIAETCMVCHSEYMWQFVATEKASTGAP